MTRHVVQFSTGAGSAEVAWRVVELYGPDDVVLLAADTLVEDEDNWRFADQVASALGLPITRVSTGETPMQVGRRNRVVPNNRFAICSRELKRKPLRAWIEAHCEPESTVVYLGFDWTEVHRYDAALPHWEPWLIAAPLIEPPYLDKTQMLDLWRERGIEPPRLYAQGFRHANCGGACVRGGQAQWRLLLEVNRDRYRQWEHEEERTRQLIGKDVSILRDRTGGRVKPLTLHAFRERIEGAPADFDADDWGPCGCTDVIGGA